MRPGWSSRRRSQDCATAVHFQTRDRLELGSDAGLGGGLACTGGGGNALCEFAAVHSISPCGHVRVRHSMAADRTTFGFKDGPRTSATGHLGWATRLTTDSCGLTFLLVSNPPSDHAIRRADPVARTGAAASQHSDMPVGCVAVGERVPFHCPRVPIRPQRGSTIVHPNSCTSTASVYARATAPPYDRASRCIRSPGGKGSPTSSSPCRYRRPGVQRIS